MILVRGILDDGLTVLSVVIEPVGHTLFRVAAVDDHAKHIKTVTARGKNHACND